MKRLLLSFILAALCLPTLLIAAGKQPFVVVIDAGHGGKDPGALGTIINEKTLNLAVTLELGKLIETNCSDVKVVYTRKTDIFLPLQERANIANRNKADLFICIHTNSAEAKSVAGAEVFTLGLNKTQSNLDVAMRENAVMLLEDGYQTTYQGFDPNSVDSYIMFEFMQDQYIDKSLNYASKAQKELCLTAGRIDRDVRQAGFWVLHKSSCPSVLVEMGFITNANEQAFLASKDGQKKIAQALFNAFTDYKREIDKKSGKPQQVSAVQPAETQPTTKAETQKQETKQTGKQTNQQPKQTNKQTDKQTNKQVSNQSDKAEEHNTSTKKDADKPQAQLAKAEDSDKPIYKIQCFAVKEPLKAGDPTFRGLKGMTYYEENTWLKYTYGDTTNYDDIALLLKELRKKFADCFIIAFYKGKKINVEEARKIK